MKKKNMGAEITLHNAAIDQTEKVMLQERVQNILQLAKQHGATAAEVSTHVDVGLSVTVRMGTVETVSFHRDKGVGITVYYNNRAGSASTTDTSWESIVSTVEVACDIAQLTGEDKYNGLADPYLMAYDYPDLDLCHPWSIQTEDAIELATRCEEEARAYDTRISNSDGASVGTVESFRVYGNSHGFIGAYPSTHHSLSCLLIAQQQNSMQRDYYYTNARDPLDMESASQVACKAAERTVRRLGAQPLSTRKVPVIILADVARGLLGHFISAISGSNLYRKSSFLLDHLGKRVFPDWVHLDEKPHLLKGLGSAPFDSEGVQTKARHIVENGILKGYVLGSYSARKLAMQTTGNANGVHNLFIVTGDKDLPALLQEMDTGFLVTEVMGQGVNIVTGDYSRGAAGYWVEKGKIQFPVEGVTIAGNLSDMFLNLAAVGNDIDNRGNIHTGSILLEQMTVAGT